MEEKVLLGKECSFSCKTAMLRVSCLFWRGWEACSFVHVVGCTVLAHVGAFQSFEMLKDNILLMEEIRLSTWDVV